MFQNITDIWYSSGHVWASEKISMARWAAKLTLIIFEHVVHLNPAGDGESSQSRAAAARAARNCPRCCKREEGDAKQ
jgi:hypothetical protein